MEVFAAAGAIKFFKRQSPNTDQYAWTLRKVANPAVALSDTDYLAA